MKGLETRAAAASAVAAIACGTVLGLRSLGLLQSAELLAYDRLALLVAPPPSPARDVAIVAIEEQDIRSFGHWPLSDRVIHDLSRALLDAGASAVGLDVYRDMPVEPGHALFEALLREEPRILGVRKVGDSDADSIPAPRALRGTDRASSNDLLLDPDGMVRRGLLFLDDHEGAVEYSFALRLALRALADAGIEAQPASEDPAWLRLGAATLRPFESNDGGYRGADAAGYQFLPRPWSARFEPEWIPIRDLLEGRVAHDRLAGRIALIGTHAESLPDSFRLPVPCATPTGQCPGVAVHAFFAQQLIDAARGVEPLLRVSSEFEELALIFAAAGAGLALGLRSSSALLQSAGALAGGLLLFGGSGAALRLGVWVPAVAPAFAWLGCQGAVTALLASLERRQRAELMQLFSRHLSPRLADELWRRRAEFFSAGGRLAPQRLDASVLFLDMKGYTARSEQLEPAELMRWISDFMGEMARLIDAHGGYVDDYFGDGIKAEWGAPIPVTSPAAIVADARRAAGCALAMGEALAEINDRYRASGQPEVALRIGIDSGPVVGGSFGDANRLKYTLVGDIVVTAQRLESLEGPPHDFDKHACRILLSERTRELLGPAFPCEFLGSHALKGQSHPVRVYRLCAAGGAAPAA